MAETDATASTADAAAKSHFTKAMEEAKAGLQAVTDSYREKLKASTAEFSAEAKARTADAQTKADGYAAQAKEKAVDLANEGKTRTSQAIVGLSKLLDDNLDTIDDKVGVRYGDYARSTSQAMKDTAGKLDEKSLEDLGNDAKEFVRTSPVLALGMAMAAGYMIGRVLKKG
ncbi:hypothetical protein [Novosphingobium sp. 9]|uniref:hypothetical protein n=1 Tax=Novosphingobium sp. 9 TaxID=2025349 RepID=UPI0021B61D81|nr:hypothetical protein [Novosphingobium sp. 9]